MRIQPVKAESITPGDTVVLRNPYLKRSPFDTEAAVKVVKVKTFDGKITGNPQVAFYESEDKVCRILNCSSIILKVV